MGSAVSNDRHTCIRPSAKDVPNTVAAARHEKNEEFFVWLFTDQQRMRQACMRWAGCCTKG
ncbi:MAG: hypothetical protein GX418_00135 [Clostridiales bacterium]|nr:hypothetical protein [Clostridiales bacterium]